MIPHSIAADFWKKLLENGVTPCGLAARDTLRIEYGLPLYGQELSEEIHPFMTRYSWVVKFNHDFIGKAALEQLKGSETLKSVGLELHEELIARPHYAIKEGGYISSGTLSPISNKSIALAFVPKELAVIGSIVTVCIRKNEVKASVVKVPFVTRN
jgi:aminomethyltransferase